MRELYSLEELASFAKAIGSELRIQIVLYVTQHPGIGLMELSEHFGVSRAAITQNIKILTAAGLIELGESGEKSSARKGCFVTEDKFLLNFRRQLLTQKIYATEIPIGQYSDFSITPTCGLATPEELIGKVDDPSFFDDPRRSQAGILWFSTGFVEYRLPNYLQKGQQLSELQLSFEVSSEAPGVAENWPSELRFRIAAPAEAQNAGGCTLFGRGFGNYDQGMKFNIIYTEE